MRVYLAGKIRGADDWRNTFVSWSNDDPDDVWSQAINWTTPVWDSGCEEGSWYVLGEKIKGTDDEIPPWPVIPNGFLGLADYVGPYAISHNEIDTYKGHNSVFGGTNGLNPEEDISSGSVRQQEIVRRCFKAIDAADVVVAIITDHSPGTLCELGYAYARQRPILAIVRGDAFDWFPKTMCHHVETFKDGSEFWEQSVMSLRHSSHNPDDPPLGIGYEFHGLYYDLRGVDLKVYYQCRWWNMRRHRALELAGMKCQLCAATSGLSVHHNSYKNLYREPDADLVVLCGPCHTTADVRRRAAESAAKV